MKRDKYMGMDVHQATTVVAVIDAEGKIVLETIVATAAAPIRRLIESISGAVYITLEETTQAEWLYEPLQGFVAEVHRKTHHRNQEARRRAYGSRQFRRNQPSPDADTESVSGLSFRVLFR